MRGTVTRTPDHIDFHDWELLSPLPGYANATVTGFGGTSGATPLVVVVAGTSYNTDPATDGVATHWRFISAPEGLIFDRAIDANQMIIVGSPGQSRLVSQITGTTPGTTLPGGFTAGTVVNDGAATAVGTPMPHAYGFESVLSTDGIPAVSTWGLAVMTVAVICAGIIVLTRARKSAQV